MTKVARQGLLAAKAKAAARAWIKQVGARADKNAP